MTTPGQTAPDGSFTLGGGPFEQWGQSITEAQVRALGVPSINPADPLGSLEDLLMRLPLEALQFFQNFITDAAEDTWLTITGAVNNILGWLVPREIMLKLAEFQAFLATLLGNPGEVIGEITQDMVQGLQDLVANFSTLVNNLLTNPGAVLGNITQTMVTGLGSALNGLSAFIQNVINSIWSALRGIPIVGAFVPGLPDLGDALQDQQIQQQNFTISALSAGYRNPTWVCRYPAADVTYPESFNTLLYVTGVTGAASAGTAHTHPVANANMTASPANWGITQDLSNGGYITVANTTVYDTAGAVVSKDAGTLNNVYLEIFRETSDGGLVRIFVSPDFSASLTLTGTYIEFDVPPIVAQAGERYLVRVRNSSTVNTVVRVAGVQQMAFAVDASLLTGNATQTDQTSYSAAEAATYRGLTTILPWAVLAAKSIVEPEVSYSDDFNREFLGPEWLTNGIVIDDGQAAYGGTTDGDQYSFRIRRTTRDASMVSGNLHVNAAGSTQHLGLLLHANRELTQFVYLATTNANTTIYSFTGGTLTPRATVAVGGTDHYSTYYDEPNDKYVALKAGEPFGLEWPSVGSTMTHSPDHRFGGKWITRNAGVNAGTIDNWTLRDFAA